MTTCLKGTDVCHVLSLKSEFSVSFALLLEKR